MKKIFFWIIGGIGVLGLGLFGWLYFKSDEFVDKFLNRDNR